MGYILEVNVSRVKGLGIKFDFYTRVKSWADIRFQMLILMEIHKIVAKNALESTQNTALFLFSSQEWPLLLFNSFIPENCYSGWENLSPHSWEPLERGRHKHSLPSGWPLQRFCLWNLRLSVTWSARQFPLASVTGPVECFDKPHNALISRA